MSFKMSKTWLAINNILNLMSSTNEGDDKGIIIEEQLSVGSPSSPKESAFGQGDSYPVPIAFHYNVSNEIGLTITGATDRTTILQSDSASSVGLFENNLSGDVLIVGSDYPPYGMKMKYDSNGVVEPGNLLTQYLNNTGSWIEESYMVTKSDYPYERKTWYLSSFPSEQVRFGINILDPQVDIAKKTLNINGVDIEKYWARVLLLSPITTLPQVQQVKVHTSRMESNADGTIELFGLSRGVKTLFAKSHANNLSDPSNENVTYFTGGIDGGSSKLIDNEFANNTRDSRILIIPIDDDIDTSSPLLISYPFYIKGNTGGNVRFDFEYVQITSDFVYDNKSEPDGATTVIYPIATNSEDKRQVVQVEIPINKIDPNIGGIAVVITRDANDSEDTVPHSVILTGDNVRARRWRV